MGNEYIRVYVNVLNTKYMEDSYSIIEDADLPIDKRNLQAIGNYLTFRFIGYDGVFDDFLGDALKQSLEALNLEFAISLITDDFSFASYYATDNFDGNYGKYLFMDSAEDLVEKESKLSIEDMVAFAARNTLVEPEIFLELLINAADNIDELDNFIMLAVANRMDTMKQYKEQKIIKINKKNEFLEYD